MTDQTKSIEHTIVVYSACDVSSKEIQVLPGDTVVFRNRVGGGMSVLVKFKGGKSPFTDGSTEFKVPNGKVVRTPTAPGPARREYEYDVVVNGDRCERLVTPKMIIRG